MTDYRITQSATYAANFNTYANTIQTYIDEHPGCMRTDIATGTGYSLTVVNVIVELLDRIQFVVPRPNEGGDETLYSAVDWFGLLVGNMGDVETWVSTHDNGLLSDMVTELSLPWAVCYALSRIVEAKAVAKLTAVIA